MIVAKEQTMATNDAEQHQLFEDAEKQHPDRIVFRLRISTPVMPGAAVGAGIWAKRVLCAKALGVLRRSAASARLHISMASQIPQRAIVDVLRTVGEDCEIGIAVLTHETVTQDRLNKALAAGAALLQTVLAGVRCECRWSDDEPPIDKPDEAVTQRARMLIAERFFSNLTTAASTTSGGTLTVRTGLPAEESEEPLPVTAGPMPPELFNETEPWHLVARLERMVSKNVMLVRRIDDQRAIRVVIAGFPTLRVDFRLLQGAGPLTLEVSGRVDATSEVDPTVRLIGQLGLATQHWSDHVDLLETLAQRLEIHRRVLQDAGLLVTTSDQNQTTLAA